MGYSGKHLATTSEYARTATMIPWLGWLSATGLAALLLMASGCAEVEPPAPSATVSPMTTAMRPAKAPDCALQILHSIPIEDVQQLALIDTWGDRSASDKDLLPVLKRKACEVGADAVVITASKDQHEGDQLQGYDSLVGSNVVNDAANVSTRQHDPSVGEVGHGGRYMSGIAIAFVKGGVDTTSSAAR
jgi:hypothetical protein